MLLTVACGRLYASAPVRARFSHRELPYLRPVVARQLRASPNTCYGLMTYAFALPRHAAYTCTLSSRDLAYPCTLTSRDAYTRNSTPPLGSSTSSANYVQDHITPNAYLYTCLSSNAFLFSHGGPFQPAGSFGGMCEEPALHYPRDARMVPT